MNIKRLQINTEAVIPLMAALPYAIAIDQPENSGLLYSPESQLTIFAGRNFSTCREDESVWPLFGRSKADTSKDD